MRPTINPISEMKQITRLALQLILIALLLITSTGLYGQNGSGSIDGAIHDATGALIPNASVTITNVGTNQVVREITGTDTGTFDVPLLPVGTYRIQVQAQGFQTQVVTIDVHVGASSSAPIVLNPGSVTESIQVLTQTDTLINSQDGSASTLIGSQKITELPLSSRNFIQLFNTQPGVSSPAPGPQDRGAIAATGLVNNASYSVNGLPSAQNAYYVDGEDLQRRSAGGNQIAAYPGIDFIQEINLQRANFGAQYAGSGGAVVSVASKAGTNRFHGSLFGFYRSQVLNANTYFNNLVGVPRAGLRYLDAGYAFGGPVYIPHVWGSAATTRTFFYFGQEYLRSLTAVQQTLTNIPTAAQKNGVFSSPVCITYTGSVCTSSSTTITPRDPTTLAYLKDIVNNIPLPNSPTDPQGYIGTARGSNDETQTYIRIDHQVTSKLSVFFRYLDDPFTLLAPNGLRQATGIPGVSTARVTDGATIFMGHATYVFAPNHVIEGGYAHMQNWVTAQATGSLLSANSPDIQVNRPFTATLGRVPDLSIGGTTMSTISPYNNRTPLTQIFINDTYNAGRHTLSFGTNLEYQQAGNNQGSPNTGTFTFSPTAVPTSSSATQFQQAFANFMLGRVTNFTQASVDSATVPHTNIYEVYGQDDFHIRPNLTINLGLRYSYIAQPSSGQLDGFPYYPFVNFSPANYSASKAPTLDRNGLICVTGAPCTGGVSPNAAADPLNGLIVANANSPYSTKVTAQPKKSFAPRFGFSYNPDGKGILSIRGGYGMYYLVLPNADYQVLATQNYPNNQNVTVPNANFTNPAGSAATLGISPSPVQAAQINARDPYVQSFSLDVQRSIKGSTLVDIGYYANVARQLELKEDINSPLPGAYAAAGVTSGAVTAANSPALNLVRPYRGFGPINAAMEGFMSNYNSLQTSLTHRFKADSIISVNYTYSKALSNANAPQNIYDPGAEYGPTSLDRRHIFNANFVYRLPFFLDQKGFWGHLLGGWETTGILSFGSGQWLTAHTAAADPAGQGILAAGSSQAGTGRPDYLGNPNDTAPHTRVKWFNTSAYTAVPAGQYRGGTARNGQIKGPGYENVDMTVFRNFKIIERMNFQLRAEAFNAFNHTNFNAVSTTTSASNYGQVTGAASNRILQLAGKLTF
jgi:hypothetical protein